MRTTIVVLLTAFVASASSLGAGWPAAGTPAWTQAAATPAPAAVARLAEAPDKRFTRADVTIRYREVGQGPAVVLLHGYSGSLAAWIGFADLLSSSHRVIAADMRGFGESSKFAEAARFGEPMADDVVHLLDHLKVERAHLVGHSMGALIAANVVARYPTRVSSAALVSGPFYGDRATFVREAAPWIKDLESGQGLANFLAWLLPNMDQKTAAMASAQAMKGNDLASLIAVLRALPDLVVAPARALAVPTLITVGTGDPLHPLSVKLAAGSKARLLEIQGADHINILRNPEMQKALRELLQSGGKTEASAAMAGATTAVAHR
jgi:pimeloyl-ACP methyl ester carboxylesterase